MKRRRNVPRATSSPTNAYAAAGPFARLVAHGHHETVRFGAKVARIAAESRAGVNRAATSAPLSRLGGSAGSNAAYARWAKQAPSPSGLVGGSFRRAALLDRHAA